MSHEELSGFVSFVARMRACGKSIAPRLHRRRGGSHIKIQFKDPVVGFGEDLSLYCCFNDRFAHMLCSEMKLCSILIFGRVLVYQRQLFMLCTQIGCGRLMMYDPMFCVHTARGVFCAQCTMRLKDDLFNANRPVPDFGLVETRCLFCIDKQLTEKNVCYIYPFGVYVCKDHHAVSADRELERLAPLATRAEVEGVLIRAHRKRTEEAMRKKAIRMRVMEARTRSVAPEDGCRLPVVTINC